jgi:hypothetical protein
MGLPVEFYHVTKADDQVFVEYVMLRGVNDGEGEAHQLGALLEGRTVVLNLIPWNPIYSPDISFEVRVPFCPISRPSAPFLNFQTSNAFFMAFFMCF